MTGRAAQVAAQAKVNLHLRILARETTGYHSIETLFHRIDLADDILVATTDAERTIDVTGHDAGPAETNLAFRAAVAYAQRAGWPRGFRIELTKKIPVGAGLGGGSADAAAVLRTLDFLAPSPIGVEAILKIAASLGSDIPFLASDAVMALAWGHGERMLSIPALPRCDLLLMTPHFGVSSADAYRWLDEDRAAAPSVKVERDSMLAARIPDPSLMSLVALSTWSGIARFARNDFEQPVAARHPEITAYLERVRNSRAIFAQMTGSGSTIFGVLSSPPNYALLPEEHRDCVTTTRTSIGVVQPVTVG